MLKTSGFSLDSTAKKMSGLREESMFSISSLLPVTTWQFATTSVSSLGFLWWEDDEALLRVDREISDGHESSVIWVLAGVDDAERLISL